MAYLYKTATKADKEQIFQLYRFVMHDSIDKIWGWKETWQIMDFNYHFKPESITLTFEKDKLIAYSQLESIDNHLHLRMLIVHPDNQGKGVGGELLKKSLSVANEQSIQLQLEVFKINKRALRFYEEYGFTIVKEKLNSYLLSSSQS